MKRITVLLADDNSDVRRGFRKLLEVEDDLEVVGEAKNGLQAVAMGYMLKQTCADGVCLSDSGSPKGEYILQPIDFPSSSQTKSDKAVGLNRVSTGHRQGMPWRADIDAFWGFDNNGKLMDFHVRKDYDAP